MGDFLALSRLPTTQRAPEFTESCSWCSIPGQCRILWGPGWLWGSSGIPGRDWAVPTSEINQGTSSLVSSTWKFSLRVQIPAFGSEDQSRVCEEQTLPGLRAAWWTSCVQEGCTQFPALLNICMAQGGLHLLKSFTPGKKPKYLTVVVPAFLWGAGIIENKTEVRWEWFQWPMNSDLSCIPKNLGCGCLKNLR